MGLTKEQMERLELLSFVKGGGFTDFFENNRKLTPTNSKILFVGLGGKGGKTIARLKTEIYKRLTVNPNTKRPNNVEYLIIDTDVGEFEQYKRGADGNIPVSDAPGDLELCQLYDDDAAKVLKLAKNKIPANIAEWINPVMNANLTGDGANGIRQAGRYLLFGNNSFSRVENALTAKLTRLHNQIVNPAAEKLIVYVIAGVGGGTGSGTIIDIPYIIRGLCERQGWDVQLNGYVFLPDTYENFATYMWYNSYAALKEIGYLMRLEDKKESAFRASYPSNNGGTFTVNTTANIFDSCVLVSGKTSTGAVANPARFSQRVVVDNIISLVSNSMIRNTVGGNTFLVNSFLDNTIQGIQNSISAFDPQIPRDADYNFKIIGIGAVVLPMEQIMAYVAYHALERMGLVWDRHPDVTDVEAWLKELHMSPDELAGRVLDRSEFPMMEYYKGIGGTADKAAVVNGSLYDTIKSIWLNRNVELYKAWGAARNQVGGDVVGLLNDSYRKAFVDPDRGIYYLRELLLSRVDAGEAFDGICRRIRADYLDQIEGLKSGARTVQAQMKERMKEIQQELDTGWHPFGGGGLIEEYRELAVGVLNEDSKMALYDWIREDIWKILDNLEQKGQNLQSCIDVFAYLSDILKDNYDSVMKGKMQTVEYATQLLNFSDGTAETEHVISYLDQMIARKPAAGLVTRLESALLKESSRWLATTDSFNPMESFVQFLTQEYSQLPQMTLESFLKVKYNTPDIQAGMAEVFTQLKNNARVIFKSTTGFPAESLLPGHRYLLVPSTSQDIVNAAAGFGAAQGLQVAVSNDPNSIYWYNVIVGVPMFAWDDLLARDCERMYEGDASVGKHIRENERENWVNLPSLLHPHYWPDDQYNPREARLRAEVFRNVKTWWDMGLVWCDPAINAIKTWISPKDSHVIKPERILKWCSEEYLPNPVKDGNGEIDSGSGFMQRMIKDLDPYRTNEILVTLPLVAVDNTTCDSAQKLLRMNWMLYKKVEETCAVLMQCREMIRKKQYEDAFFELFWAGMIRIDGDFVKLIRPNGQELELADFYALSGAAAENYIYTACDNFRSRVSQAELEDLLRHQKAYVTAHKLDQKQAFIANEGVLLGICMDMLNSFKKLDTQKRYEKLKDNRGIEEYARFYDEMLLRKKGVNIRR